MILIGQYDSPFVRRVGIALALYGLAFEHRPWSVFGDADVLGEINPLRRVPTLITGDGTVLTDSAAILDCLDHMVDPDRALIPASGNARRDVLRIAAFTCGLGEKAVSLFYEHRLHDVTSQLWIERCTSQMLGTLTMLERERAALMRSYWGGERPGHADIAVACVLRFIGEAHPGLIDWSAFPALTAHCETCEEMDVFQAIAQPFIPPA